VPGVPQNIEFIDFYFFTTKGGPNDLGQIVILALPGAPPIFFSLTGYREPKKVEKHCSRALFLNLLGFKSR